MRYLLLFLFCSSIACTASDPTAVVDDGLDTDLSDVGVDATTFVWPAPKFTEADYLAVAQEICSNPNPDPKKLVFSTVGNFYHLSGEALFIRNGDYYLHINESCEMWVLQFREGDNMLEAPLHKQIGPEVLAHILKGFRALEFAEFDEAGQTDFSYVLSPSWNLFYFQGGTYAFDIEYGPQALGSHPESLNDLELLVAAILKYDVLKDPLVLDGLTPYVGDRIWINVLIQGSPIPERLLQPWPLLQSPEELGPNYGCSDNFVAFIGEEADQLRATKDLVLSQPPPTSAGHWAVPMESGPTKYWVTMSEGLPMEDEFGYIKFRDYRLRSIPCD